MSAATTPVAPAAALPPEPQRFERPGVFRAEAVVSLLNRRLRIVSYRAADHGAMVAELRRQAADRELGKIFLKAPAGDRAALKAAGMVCEATIRGYFDGSDAAVMAFFVEDARRERPHRDEEERILAAVQATPPSDALHPLPEGYEVRRAQPADADELAALYSKVFASYPFPISEPAYLRDTMASHVVYEIVRDGDGELVAAASAETDLGHGNAEMTDFATLPSQRGLGLARRLLDGLEAVMGAAGITNLYTIARARSAGMNRVFFNQGYDWTGTLVNNCHIAGQFEDMHVWCRQLT